MNIKSRIATAFVAMQRRQASAAHCSPATLPKISVSIFGGQLVDKLVVSLVDKKYQKRTKTHDQQITKRLKRQHGQ
jgi:hypothetical protein